MVDAATPAKVLGVHVGGEQTATADFEATIAKVAHARRAINSLDHPPCELTLQRRCMDVSKAAYILRCNGDRVSEAALHSFDGGVRAGVEETLAGGISDESWVQATLGVDAAGLGFREAAAVALLDTGRTAGGSSAHQPGKSGRGTGARKQGGGSCLQEGFPSWGSARFPQGPEAFL